MLIDDVVAQLKLLREQNGNIAVNIALNESMFPAVEVKINETFEDIWHQKKQISVKTRVAVVAIIQGEI